MITERIVLNEKRKVTLTAYIQEVGGEFIGLDKRPAVIILPGGGYHICSDRESDPVAFAFLKAGFDAFILRYSVYGADGELSGNADWPNPLSDYEQAMRLIKAKACEWNIMTDKIAVIGFSAGGHLAGAAMTLSAGDTRPAAGILGYPVDEWGKDNNYHISAPVIHEAITVETCPCFIFALRDDGTVPIQNSIMLMEAMADKGVKFECHIYGHGPHGCSTCEEWLERQDFCRRVPNWTGDCIAWLKETLDVLK